MRAGLGRGFQHPRTQALARHFQQAKARNPPDLNAGAVGFQLVLDALFHRQIVAAFFHVDEVNHDQPSQVAQAQLAGNLFGGFKVGFQRGVFDRAFFGGAARVHVDGHQRLGHADDDIAPRFQLNRGVEHSRQIAFDLIARKQRHLVIMALHHFGVRRHDHLHKVFGGAVACFAFNQNLVNLAAVQIADGSFDQIAFFVNGGGSHRFQRQFANLLPQTHQIFVIAVDFGLGALGTRRADD